MCIGKTKGRSESIRRWALNEIKSAVTRSEDPLESIEDQVEAEHKLILVIRVSPLRVMFYMFREVRQVLVRHISEEGGGESADVFFASQVHPDLPKREANDVAVQRVIRMMCCVDAESS